ncbi:hypothetical protein BOX15_Mlig016723g1 [Macrostomum lignano]|uniref:Uncharacterized protein n=1 Tax=Macrostomum lignano TaxID=282301 RepID=A0A267F1E8_9PLAT|nr:hypothetical protein BOX15_Mlig016723g1 [Macrostomum lignano]
MKSAKAAGIVIKQRCLLMESNHMEPRIQLDLTRNAFSAKIRARCSFKSSSPGAKGFSTASRRNVHGYLGTTAKSKLC